MPSQNVYDSSRTQLNNGMTFSTRGLHMANLNIRHLLPNLDEMKIVLSQRKCPDILGICETFLVDEVPDTQMSIPGYVMHRKDRTVTIDKQGGGLVFYIRENIECNRRKEFEISDIETMWVEVVQPHSRPFLL